MKKRRRKKRKITLNYLKYKWKRSSLEVKGIIASFILGIIFLSLKYKSLMIGFWFGNYFEWWNLFYTGLGNPFSRALLFYWLVETWYYFIFNIFLVWWIINKVFRGK